MICPQEEGWVGRDSKLSGLVSAYEINLNSMNRGRETIILITI